MKDNNVCVLCEKKIFYGVICDKSHNEEKDYYKIYDRYGVLINPKLKNVNINDYSKMMEKEFSQRKVRY